MAEAEVPHDLFATGPGRAAPAVGPFADAEAILNLAISSAGIGVWDLDLLTGLVRGSPEFFVIMGLEPTAEPVPLEVIRGLRPPADQEQLFKAYSDAVASGADYLEAEYRVVRPDGTPRWIVGRGRVIRDAEGVPIRYIGVDVDVTRRKLADAALRESEELFRLVFEQSPLGKVLAGQDFRFRAVNPALCAMLGYAEEELLGKSFLDIVHPDDRRSCEEHGRLLISGSIPRIQIEKRFVRRSGNAMWVSVNVGRVHDADGNIRYTLGIIENIEERKQYARALEDSEARLRLLNEKLAQQAKERTSQLASSQAQLQAFFINSRDWLTLQRVTSDGQIIYADINPACEAAYGIAREQVIGRTVEEVIGIEASQVPVHHLLECLRTGQPQRYVARRTMAGITTTIDVMFVLVPGIADTDDRFIITSARDITEHEQLEAQLRQAQKMEAIGQLTGGVAHDFNNLLAIIGGNAELAKRRPLGSSTRQLDNILRATERGAALTRQLLSFSRRNISAPQVMDLGAEIHRMAEMLRASLRGDIQMNVQVAPGVWHVEVDLAELEMALVNIAVNARDAMPQGGTFTIDVRKAAQSGSTVNSDSVAIGLHDSGVGIAPDIISKVFDPFFTTKEAGAGTGLGLSQVYGFARQSGGEVSLDSMPGRGTTITIRLPLSNKPLPMAKKESIACQRADGCILLVEDNPQVAEVTAQMLSAMGFRVEVTDRALKALQLLDTTMPDINLLITDVVMPDLMTGVDLANQVRRRFPSLPIILSSGYNNVVVPGGVPFTVLRKPVSYDDLYRAVRAALDDARKL